MAELINKTDTLNQGRVKLNAAITDAETAKGISKQADVKATQALANSESTQTQLDTIVIEGDSSVEAAQARVDEKGESHPTLKARIDNGFTEVSGQLYNTLKDIEERAINVKSPPAPLIGAVGDGVTDDLEAFLGVLNYLKSKGGGTVFIPGTDNFYAVSNSLEIDESYGHINIVGEGRRSHVKLINKSFRGHMFGFSGSGSDETNWVTGGSIKNIAASTYEGTESQDDNPIGISRSKNIIIENVYVPYSNWKGITVQYHAKNIKIINCETHNCRKYGVSIEFSSVSDVEILNLITHHNGEEGLIITNAGEPNKIKGMKAKNITSYENGGTGISISGAEFPEVDAISFLNRKHGIHVFNSNNAKINGTIYNNDLAGVRFQTGKGHSFSGVSKNNSLNDSLIRGNVFIESSPDSKITDADISEGLRAYTNWSENISFTNVKTEGTTNFPSETPAARFTSGINVGREYKIVFVNGKPTEGYFPQVTLCIEASPSSGKPAIYYTSSIGKAHKDSYGDLANGSKTISNVTNIDTWKVGDIIKAPTIPFGTTVTAVGESTLTISAAPTTNGRYLLYDAKFESFLNVP